MTVLIMSVQRSARLRSPIGRFFSIWSRRRIEHPVPENAGDLSGLVADRWLRTVTGAVS